MIRSHYVNQLSASMDGKEVVLAGWVHEVRETGKITFLLLRDRTGVVQIIGKAGDTKDSKRVVEDVKNLKGSWIQNIFSYILNIAMACKCHSNIQFVMNNL